MAGGRAGGQASSTYTERFRSSLMALISIFLRPIVDVDARRQSAWSDGERSAWACGGSSRVVEGLVGGKRMLGAASLRGTHTASVSARERGRAAEVGARAEGGRARRARGAIWAAWAAVVSQAVAEGRRAVCSRGNDDGVGWAPLYLESPSAAQQRLQRLQRPGHAIANMPAYGLFARFVPWRRACHWPCRASVNVPTPA